MGYDRALRDDDLCLDGGDALRLVVGDEGGRGRDWRAANFAGNAGHELGFSGSGRRTVGCFDASNGSLECESPYVLDGIVCLLRD